MQVADKNREVRTTIVMAVLCLILQLTLAPNLGLANGRANFAFVFTVCLGLSSGGRSAVIGGFLAGLLFDLSATNPIGLMAFCLTLVGYAFGMRARERLAGDTVSSLVYVAVASLLVSLVYHLAMLLVGQTASFFDAMALRMLPTAFLTFIAFLPFAYYFSRVRTSASSLGGHLRSGGVSRRGL